MLPPLLSSDILDEHVSLAVEGESVGLEDVAVVELGQVVDVDLASLKTDALNHQDYIQNFIKPSPLNRQILHCRLCLVYFILSRNITERIYEFFGLQMQLDYGLKLANTEVPYQQLAAS